MEMNRTRKLFTWDEQSLNNQLCSLIERSRSEKVQLSYLFHGTRVARLDYLL
ncbi:hypothetical protein GCM10007854_30670 [Algimonas porphyrae]|uniref:Uncharacterized protein n=1 Tax=Algimonas porphyrae TaxID=1128113 RepID=A0ABQ5V553_9PROT|nr:hypothetical protein GCM10007854_30670 [Algimonas porphyrae]